MRRFWTALVLAAALAACGQQTVTSEDAPSGGAPAEADGVIGNFSMEQGRASDAREEAQSEAPAAAPAPPQDATAPTTASPGPSQPAGPAPVLYLAYSYGLGLEIPSQRLAAVMDRHIEACQTAGPRQCQLIGSNRSGDPDSYMDGYVSLRGEPAWLRAFMAGMSAQVDEAAAILV